MSPSASKDFPSLDEVSGEVFLNLRLPMYLTCELTAYNLKISVIIIKQHIHCP